MIREGRHKNSFLGQDGRQINRAPLELCILI